MTVSSDTSKSGPYLGNGVTTTFAYLFKILADTEILVVRTNADTSETVLTLGAHYSVTGVGSDTGNVVLSAPADDLPTGTSLTLYRNVSLTQELDLVNQGEYFAEDIETALDRQMMATQQVDEKTERALTVLTAATNAQASASNSAAAAAISETNAALSEEAALVSELAAASYAAGLDLPAIGGGDVGKALVVASGGANWDLTDGTLVALITSTALAACFPVGAIYYTAANTNPSSLGLPGTWTQRAQGRFIVGVGQGTDANAVNRTFAAGNTTGEFQHTLLEAELPSHRHRMFANQTGSSGLGLDTQPNRRTKFVLTGSGATDYGMQAANADGDEATLGYTGPGAGVATAFTQTPPGYGLYVWERTA